MSHPAGHPPRAASRNGPVPWRRLSPLDSVEDGFVPCAAGADSVALAAPFLMEPMMARSRRLARRHRLALVGFGVGHDGSGDAALVVTFRSPEQAALFRLAW